MNRTDIKDAYGRVLGWVETQPNGDEIIKDFYGKVLGRYDKQMDVTRDYYGRIIFKGNHLSYLLKDNI